MKSRLWLVGLGLLALIGVAASQERTALWKRVEAAASKGLPKTAIATLDTIVRRAQLARDYPDAVRAIVQRIAMQGTVEGDHAEEKIRRLQREIPRSPAEMRPVMESVLAHWYWEYYQQNNWRFLQRTATTAVVDSDFTTWDLRRIYAEIDRHFVAALAGAPQLQRIPVARWGKLLEAGNVPDSWRPTLYDFLAHDAIAFYASGEQAGARPEDSFALRPGDPVFAPASEFVAWTIATTDSTSPGVRALKLYQDVLRFHLALGDTTALLDADLDRLEYAYAHATDADKDARYMAALERIASRWAGHEISARALHAWASVLSQQGDRVGARDLARRGLQRFPDSVGGRRCFNLIQQLESKSFELMLADRVWHTDGAELRVSYRNIDRIELRLVRVDRDALLARADHEFDQIDDPDVQAALARPAVRTWTAELPPTLDLKDRARRLTVPGRVEPGAYLLIAQAGPAGDAASRVVHVALVFRADLAVVQRRGDSRVGDGLVVRASTGEPVRGARVRPWTIESGRRYVGGAVTTSDVDGRFDSPSERNYGAALEVQAGAEWLLVRPTWRGSRRIPERPSDQTMFFTDRAIYRPGQTVQYKGLCIHVDREGNRYGTLPGQALTVVFRDPNGKEIERRSHRANAQGSFSGSFTAPRDRLMGAMSIAVDGAPQGATSFSVEEYKRPKFAVTMAAPASAARLDAEVSTVGTATAYTGAPVDGAAVKWRVVRMATYPAWWGWRYWWRPTPATAAQEIAHGETSTDAEGRFTVAFVARPSPGAKPEDEPTFHYTIHADVTDAAGETRSVDRTVNVGWTALSASLWANDWQQDDRPVALNLRTATLDGEPRPAVGELVIEALRQPRAPQRDAGFENLRGGQPWPEEDEKLGVSAPDTAQFSRDPGAWPVAREVRRQRVVLDSTGTLNVNVPLAAGVYRARFETRDPFGKVVRAEAPVRVLSLRDTRLPIAVPDVFAAPAWSVEPGQEFVAVWGTGYARGRALVEVEHHGQVLQSYWTEAGRTQVVIRQPVTEAMRGGFTVRVTAVLDNRLYARSRQVDVPWSNKQLTVRWEHFVSKLMPGQKETWTAVITAPDGAAPGAEMVATLYDASLDAFRSLGWPDLGGLFRRDWSWVSADLANGPTGLHWVHGTWPTTWRDESLQHRHYPYGLLDRPFGMRAELDESSAQYGQTLGVGNLQSVRELSVAAPAMAKSAGLQLRGGRSNEVDMRVDGAGVAEGEAAADRLDVTHGSTSPALDEVTARRNLNETAFFFPHLLADAKGEVRMEFTMPEALTRWRFLGYAHDATLRSGQLAGTAVTAKDLMVQPNPPRFLREGDELEFTVKVTNTADTPQKGRVRLTLADAATDAPADAALGNATPEQALDVPAHASRTYAWKLRVPDGTGALTYKAVAATKTLSDGEEGVLPVLARRVLVTESLPLPIRGAQTKAFDFARLSQSGASNTLQHQSLTVQMVSNPAWYAVMALPYLMEYPYECSEQTFNRLYANTLARHIAGSDPRIHRVFEQWRGTPALDSPLEKNPDLKSVTIEETPWLRQANRESQARRNVGVLFDDNRLDSETARTLEKLRQMQLPDGAWPWFPGGRADDYITLYVATGFGRLKHLGVNVPDDMAVRALSRMDGWSDRVYRDVLAHSDSSLNHLSPTIALYLYGRSFFEREHPVPAPQRTALNYWLRQARKHWLSLGSRQSQAHVALALQRYGDAGTARGIVRSLKERSVSNEEMGMFWRDTELSWWWYRAPIESQAMMIEAFAEIAHDSVAVDDCQTWLLKQKQTQDWKTTRATADAVYALLLRGRNLLASTALVEVSLGGRRIEPERVEAGTGFYEQRFGRGEIVPAMGRIEVRKSDPGVAWGSVHWQYLEDMNKVTPYAGTPLTLEKKLFIRRASKSGPVLDAVNGPIQVGDELVVRVVLRTDRDMEYVHLEDYRGSGTEPVDVLSGYRYQDGLAYYQQTRDVASHFFIDYLPKGTYVFEYATRVQHRGRYQTGVAKIQCMYAPEFNSHSASPMLEVR